MEKLDSVHKKELTSADFDRFPVWVWDDEQRGYQPLTGNGPMPREFGTLFVRATFAPRFGPSISGYLIGLRSFYAFGFFVDGEHYVLNLNAPDLAADVLKSVAQKLGVQDALPMRYRCEVFENQPPIEGVLKI